MGLLLGVYSALETETLENNGSREIAVLLYVWVGSHKVRCLLRGSGRGDGAKHTCSKRIARFPVISLLDICNNVKKAL